MRERRLLAALERGERSRAALLAEAWDDIPVELLPMAAMAMESHLEKLEAEGGSQTTSATDAQLFLSSASAGKEQLG